MTAFTCIHGVTSEGNHVIKIIKILILLLRGSYVGQMIVARIMSSQEEYWRADTRLKFKMSSNSLILKTSLHYIILYIQNVEM